MVRFFTAKLMAWLEKSLDNPPNLGFMRQLFDAVYLRRFYRERCSITVYNRERLPKEGPAIFVCNHESLTDAVIIQQCYPLAMLPVIRPTGARDFFKQKGLLQYFMAGSMMRLCFFERGSGEAAKAGEVDPFATFHAPLQAGNLLIYFPQGTRDAGAPFRTGIYHLAKRYRDVPIIPVLLRGTREFHPKGVSFFKFFPEHPVTMWVGESFPFDSDLSPWEYAARLEEYVFSLSQGW